MNLRKRRNVHLPKLNDTVDRAIIESERGNSFDPVNPVLSFNWTRTPQAPAYRRHLTRPHLTDAKQDNPNEVCFGSNPTVRKGQSLSGNRTAQEANASTPKGNGKS